MSDDDGKIRWMAGTLLVAAGISCAGECLPLSSGQARAHCLQTPKELCEARLSRTAPENMGDLHTRLTDPEFTVVNSSTASSTPSLSLAHGTGLAAS